MGTALFYVEGTPGDGKLVLGDEGKRLPTPYCSPLTDRIPAWVILGLQNLLIMLRKGVIESCAALKYRLTRMHGHFILRRPGVG